jgi:hypothetical protein
MRLGFQFQVLRYMHAEEEAAKAFLSLSLFVQPSFLYGSPAKL